jgi:hydrogenase maturation protease
LNFETVIIGIGNPLAGDDGAGARVIELLEKAGVPAELVVMGTPGYGLITYLEGKKRVIIVDAAFYNGRAGEVRMVPWTELIDQGTHTTLNQHGPGLLQTLEQARILGLLPNEVLVCCIQAGSASPGQGLGLETEAGAQAAARQIIHMLKGPRHA